MTVLVREENGWEVWISLDDHHPLRDRFGFCIGLGLSRASAVSDAVTELEAVIEKLARSRP